MSAAPPAIPVVLVQREPPHAAIAVLARGAEAVAALAEATRRRLAGGAALRAARGEGWLVVLGDAEDLPWAEGVRYLGRDGPLLVPTTRTASPAPDLVAAALGVQAGELVVLLEDVVLRGPAPARPADPERLP